MSSSVTMRGESVDAVLVLVGVPETATPGGLAFSKGLDAFRPSVAPAAGAAGNSPPGKTPSLDPALDAGAGAVTPPAFAPPAFAAPAFTPPALVGEGSARNHPGGLARKRLVPAGARIGGGTQAGMDAGMARRLMGTGLTRREGSGDPRGEG